MVFYYTSLDGHLIYKGKDKFENEELIKFGINIDVWFHVDNLSSAHVYLRLNPGETWDTLNPDLIAECC
jgi:predicted ribosome quality control (RQC) complex YloA/Tae2 family protein